LKEKCGDFENYFHELAQALPAKRREKGCGDENEKLLNHDVIPHPQATRKASDTRTTTKLM